MGNSVKRLTPVLALAALVGPSQAIAQEQGRSCGQSTARGYYHIVFEVAVVKGEVDCAEAKQIALRSWTRRVDNPEGWTCYGAVEADWDVTCGYRTNPHYPQDEREGASASYMISPDYGKVIEYSERAFTIREIDRYPSARAKRDARRRNARLRRAPHKRCGNATFQNSGGVGSYDVRAKNLSCKTARSVAKRWFFGGVCDGNPCFVSGYSCRVRRTSRQYQGRVRCTGTSYRVITFLAQFD